MQAHCPRPILSPALWRNKFTVLPENERQWRRTLERRARPKNFFLYFVPRQPFFEVQRVEPIDGGPHQLSGNPSHIRVVRAACVRIASVLQRNHQAAQDRVGSREIVALDFDRVAQRLGIRHYGSWVSIAAPSGAPMSPGISIAARLPRTHRRTSRCLFIPVKP